MKWSNTYRLATPLEIEELQNRPGAPHVLYGCTDCGLGTWSAKNLTLGKDGNYVAVRNIFYNGDEPECNCPPSALRCVVPK